MCLEPQRIGAEIKIAGPFQSTAAVANSGLSEDRRVTEGGEHAIADKVVEAVLRLSTVGPRNVDAIAPRVRLDADDPVFGWSGHGSNPLWRFVLLAADPVQGKRFLVGRRPILNRSDGRGWQRSAKDGKSPDSEQRFMLPQRSMKMGWGMVAEIHHDLDSVDDGYGRHGWGDLLQGP